METISHAPGFSLTLLHPPYPIPLGCISVLVTLTLCYHHCPNIHLFIYRGREEREWDVLKALCSLSVSENSCCCREKL